MNRSVKYASAIVVVHLLINIVHGLAYHKLHASIVPPAPTFVIVVILICPLIAMGLLWTSTKRFGLTLFSLTLFGSLIFRMTHEFVTPIANRASPSGWDTTFHLTAYLLFLTEAIGIAVGIHFFEIWKAKRTRDLRWAAVLGMVVLALASWQCCFVPNPRPGSPYFKECDEVSLLPGMLPAAFLDLGPRYLNLGPFGFSLIWFFAVCYAFLKSWRLLVHAVMNRGDVRWALLAGVALSVVAGVLGFAGLLHWDLLLAPGVYANQFATMFFFPLGWFVPPGINEAVPSYIFLFGFTIFLYSALFLALIKVWHLLAHSVHRGSRGT